ncbi:MAG: glycosyl hydrolase [Kiritimatiellia bacterium]
MKDNNTVWPEITPESQPWTRWWWFGSAVNKTTITRLLQEYRRVGLGGVEITSIYGVKGAEAENIKYLSPEWCGMVRHTVREAERLGMKVDLPPGSGWKMGGDFLDESLGAVRMRIESNGVVVEHSHEMIKRPGPGGGGLAFNPFDHASAQAVFDHFTPAFTHLGIRAQFHDSWEYGANARSDIIGVFEKRYGYDFTEHPAADGSLPPGVRYDLQYLLGELALEAFILPWSRWCRQLGHLSRNQAHGSPGNLLDLYAACDIPETEIFRHVTPDTPLLSKFASSAAHITGKTLVSSETGTWIREHFHVSLADLKQLCDNLFVSGINHHVYHGTAYSPEDTPWPGWLFYASAQLNPQNSIWRDFHKLNEYVTRCQSVLQEGMPDNDLLVYFPVHDILRDPEHPLAGKLHIQGDWLLKRPVAETLRGLWKRGYGFDYISDRQIATLTVKDGQVAAPGGAYKALLVPPCETMPVATLDRLVHLSRNGAAILFQSPGPGDVPGFSRLKENRARFAALTQAVIPVEDWEDALASAGLSREILTDSKGLYYQRRRHADGHCYFLINQGTESINTRIQLSVDFETAVIMDPMTGQLGATEVRGNRVRVQMDPGASLILKTNARSDRSWTYREPNSQTYDLKGPWRVRFLEGGPDLPEPYETERLESWAERGGAYEAFAGTAELSTTFDAPGPDASWLLDLGTVYSSARVRLNGREVATLIGPAYTVDLPMLKPAGNRLDVEVTSLAANRIRDMDRRGVDWRIFEDINFVNLDYKSFDASNWPVVPVGLLGPVRLIRQAAKNE